MGLLNLNSVLAGAGLPPAPFAQGEIQFQDREQLVRLFADPDLTSTLPNPLVADAEGVFDLCFLIDGTYRILFTDGQGQPMTDVDEHFVRNADGRGILNGFPDFGALEDDLTMSYAERRGSLRVTDGDFVKVLDGDRAYRVAPEGATDAPIVTRGGVRIYVNSNKYDISAADFGVRLTGDPADALTNRTGLQKAIDHLDRLGQGGRIRLGGEGDCVVDLPPQLLDRIELDLGGGILRNTRGAAGYDKFLSTQALQVGKMHPAHMDVLTWHRLDAVGFGDDGVTASDPGGTADFLPGDMVLVARANPAMGAGIKALPDWAQWNRVHAVSGSTIHLERGMERALDAGGGAMGSDAGGAWIANVAARRRHLVDWQADMAGWIDGAPFLCYRPGVVNGTLMTAHGGVMQAVGMFEGLWEDLRCHPGEAADGKGYGGIFSNAFAHSRLRRIVSSCYARAIEVKCLSQHSLVEDFEVYALNHPHGTTEAQDPPVAVGEYSRGVTFRNGVVNLGRLNDGAATSGYNLVGFTPARDCGFERVKFVSATQWATLVAGDADSAGCFVRRCDFDAPGNIGVETGMPDFDFSDNILRHAPGLYAARLHAQMRGGRISGNDFRGEGAVKILPPADGAATGTEITGNRGISGIDDDSDGGRAVLRDNRCAGWDRIGFAGARRGQQNIAVTATAEAPIGAPVILPAGTLNPGDRFEWTVTCSLAATSDCMLAFRAAVDSDDDGAALDGGDDGNVAASFTIPAGCTDLRATFSVQVFGTNALHTLAEAVDLGNGAVLAGGDVNRHNAAAFATHDLRLELSGHKGAAGDIMIVRTLNRTATRAGYRN